MFSSSVDWDKIHMFICPMIGQCMSSCPMVSQCMSNCHIIGQCIFTCPMVWQCVSNCPMVEQWMSNCPIFGQCIFYCLMVRQCMSNGPAVRWFYMVCPTVQWLDSGCSGVWWLNSAYSTVFNCSKWPQFILLLLLIFRLRVVLSRVTFWSRLHGGPHILYILYKPYGTKSKANNSHVNVTKFYALFQAENHGKIGAFWKIILVWPSHAIGQFQTFLTPVHCTALGCSALH
jgi:hypothetical protein